MVSIQRHALELAAVQGHDALANDHPDVCTERGESGLGGGAGRGGRAPRLAQKRAALTGQHDKATGLPDPDLNLRLHRCAGAHFLQQRSQGNAQPAGVTKQHALFAVGIAEVAVDAIVAAA